MHFTLGQIRDVVVVEITDSALERFVSPSQLDVFCVPQAAAGSAFVLLADDDSSDGMDLPHAVARLLGGTGPADGLLAGGGEGVDRRRISRALAYFVESLTRLNASVRSSRRRNCGPR